MTVALRPTSLGEILDRTFQIYRSRFWGFAGIAILSTISALTVNIIDGIWIHLRSHFPVPNQSETWIRDFLIWLAFYHIASLLHSIFMPGLVHQASAAATGENCSFQSAVRLVLRRGIGFLWIGFLKVAVGMLVPEILIALVVFGAGSIAGAVDVGVTTPLVVLIVFVPLLAGLVLAQWLGGCLSLSFAAGTVEQLRGVKALRRSWVLSMERRGAIQLTWIAFFLSYHLAIVVGQGALRWGWVLVWRAFHFHYSRGFYDASFYVFYAALATLAGPIFPIIATLFYYDQRIRKEGYDIERMMDAAGMTAVAVPVASMAEDLSPQVTNSAEAEVQPG